MQPDRGNQPQASDWIAVFDSGLGGLAVVKELSAALPCEKIHYFGDTLHMPYGSRSLDDIRDLSERIVDYLLPLPAKIVVIACNTASAAALKHVRGKYPHMRFVGMEPAVKPAVLESAARKVGVLATPATFQGEPFKRLVEQYADGATVYAQPCPGLADAVEREGAGGGRVIALLQRFIRPLVDNGIDRLVLGCTHYSLVIADIQRLFGDDVHIVDPSPAVARRVAQVLAEDGLIAEEAPGDLVIQVSGDAVAFSQSAARELGIPVLATTARFFPEVAGFR